MSEGYSEYGKGDHYLVVETTGEYQVEHPDTCKPFLEDGIQFWPCDEWKAVCEGDADGAEELSNPGKYQIKLWGSKYWTDYGWDYDGGINLISAEDQSNDH